MTTPSTPLDLEPSVIALAESLGVSRQAVYDWIAQGCPRSWRDAVIQWREQNKRGASSAASDLNRAEKLARIRRTLAEAEAKELANREARGELVPRADVVLAAAEAFSTVRARIELITDAVLAEVPTDLRPQVQPAVANQIYLSLKELSETQILRGATFAQVVLECAEKLRSENYQPQERRYGTQEEISHAD
jgi:hypothetical protein